MSVSEREVPEGYRLEWVRDDLWDLDVSNAPQCRMRGCNEPAVARLWRHSSARNAAYPWAYCPAHLYGRKIVDGVVKVQRLVEIPEAGAGPCAAGEPQQ